MNSNTFESLNNRIDLQPKFREVFRSHTERKVEQDDAQRRSKKTVLKKAIIAHEYNNDNNNNNNDNDDNNIDRNKIISRIPSEIDVDENEDSKKEKDKYDDDYNNNNNNNDEKDDDNDDNDEKDDDNDDNDDDDDDNYNNNDDSDDEDRVCVVQSTEALPIRTTHNSPDIGGGGFGGSSGYQRDFIMRSMEHREISETGDIVDLSTVGRLSNASANADIFDERVMKQWPQQISMQTRPPPFQQSQSQLPQQQQQQQQQQPALQENLFIIMGPPPQANGLKHIELQDAKELVRQLSKMKFSTKKPLWVDLTCDKVTFEEFALHIKPKIHPLTIEDCVSRDCREKVEVFENYWFVSVRAPTRDRVRVQHIAIVVFKSIIFTYHEQPAAVMNETRKIIKKRHFPGMYTTKWLCPSPGWVCHAIVDGIIDSLIPEVNRVVSEVASLEEMVLIIGVNSQQELLQRFQNARSWLGIYRHRLWPKSIVLNNLTRNFLEDVPAPYWRDVNDHLTQMVGILEVSLRTLDQLQSMFVAQVSLDMTKHGSHLNMVAQKLGIVTAIFIPLLFWGSLWGMNCWIPFQISLTDILPERLLPLGMVFVCGIMGLSALITYFTAKTWLGKNKLSDN